tara:strand:+ start:141 stop:428 length:288 start_codon:yes stop_codon:yes gene_type:complete
MNRAKRIETLLTNGLQPSHVAVVDESELHAGHAGARDGGETHYRVMVVAGVFEGESRVARQRRVNELLAGEFATGLHALSVRALTNAEYQNTETT